jgi:Leucine-rich repeat (LRR) protein
MFEELPDELGLFSRLERLDLSWGILRALPGSLGDLPRLVALDISGQRFDQVPQVVLSMTGLTHLQVGLNHHGGGQRPLWLTQEQRGALPALRHLTEGDQHPALDLLTAQLV